MVTIPAGRDLRPLTDWLRRRGETPSDITIPMGETRARAEIAAGRLKATRVGNRVYVSRAEVERFLDELASA